MARQISHDALARRLATGEPVTLVEALGPDYYADAHLPGAVNIPAARVGALAPGLIPDRSTSVVVYCSRSCSEAAVVASALETLGYRDVSVYPDGKERWIEAGLPIARQ